MLRAAALLLLAIPLLVGSLTAQSSASLDKPQDPATVTLRPGDSIRLEVWREKDMSGSFLVDENGVATLPLLGEVKISEIPLTELRERLLSEYRRLLRNPSIQIIPLREVLVMGEVRQPGPYSVDPTESLMGVVAMAEGPTGAGDPRNIEIVRGGQTVVKRAAPGKTLTELAVRSGDQIVVHPRSWLSRNRSFVVSLLLALPSVVYTISRIN
jgi:polysaccharide export outer membrane protein